MSAPLLEVEGLTRHFVARRSVFGRPTATVKAVDGIDLSVPAGSTLALVGETGCGKSTVGRLVLRLIEPLAGSVRFAGRDILEFGEKELRAFRREAQIVFQDPYSSLNPRMTVDELIGEPLGLHDIVPASRRRDRVAQLLGLVGLDARYGRRYPHEFSGGQRQRIAIARALAVEPKLIVCDEPVSALDVSIRSQVLNLLSDLRKRLSLTYIFISHDLSVVKHIADRVAVMYLGRIVESAPADELFANPRHPYTRALFSAIPVPQPLVQRQRQFCRAMFQAPFHHPPAAIFTRVVPTPSTDAVPSDPRLSTTTRGTRPPAIAGASCPPWWEYPDRTRPPPSYEALMAKFTRPADVRAGRRC